jgi:hypothetical protein
MRRKSATQSTPHARILTDLLEIIRENSKARLKKLHLFVRQPSTIQEVIRRLLDQLGDSKDENNGRIPRSGLLEGKENSTCTLALAREQNSEQSNDCLSTSTLALGDINTAGGAIAP